jgi:hypothetical protein
MPFGIAIRRLAHTLLLCLATGAALHEASALLLPYPLLALLPRSSPLLRTRRSEAAGLLMRSRGGTGAWAEAPSSPAGVDEAAPTLPAVTVPSTLDLLKFAGPALCVFLAAPLMSIVDTVR